MPSPRDYRSRRDSGVLLIPHHATQKKKKNARKCNYRIAVAITLSLWLFWILVCSLMKTPCRPTPHNEHPLQYQLDHALFRHYYETLPVPLNGILSKKGYVSGDNKNINANAVVETGTGFVDKPQEIGVIVLADDVDAERYISALKLTWVAEAEDLGFRVEFMRSSLRPIRDRIDDSPLLTMPPVSRLSFALESLSSASFYFFCNYSTYLRPRKLFDFIKTIPKGDSSAFGHTKYGFLDIGAGQIFSRPSVEAALNGFLQQADGCESTNVVLEDMTLSKCAKATGTTLRTHPEMHRYPPHEFWGCAAEGVYRIAGYSRIYDVADLHDEWMTFHDMSPEYMHSIHRFLKAYDRVGSNCAIGGLSALYICVKHGYIEDEALIASKIFSFLSFVAVIGVTLAVLYYKGYFDKVLFLYRSSSSNFSFLVACLKLTYTLFTTYIVYAIASIRWRVASGQRRFQRSASMRSSTYYPP